MLHRPPLNLPKGGLLALLAVCLGGVGPGAMASEVCDLKYQSSARGQWAIQRKPGDHFVFRTQRKLLEPPAIDGVGMYYDVAEDAALDSLTAYLTRHLSGHGQNGQLQLARSPKPQRVRCADENWTVFTYELAKVSWSRAESAQPVPVAAPVAAPMAAAAPPVAPTPPSAAAPAAVPVPPKGRAPAAAAKAPSSTLKTYEE